VRRIVFLALLVASPALAQRAASPTVELEGKLSAATRDTLDAIVSAARARGLPTAPLVAKAAEGVLKQGDEARILRAVRNLATQLAASRELLRRDAAPGTLIAAASALQAGVTSAQLSRVIAAAPENDAELAVGFVTLADLVASTVSAESAVTSVEQLLQRRAPAAEMAAFRAAVARDIQAGRSPEDALATRTKAVVRSLQP
jgi:hypothetical protein